MIHLLIEIYHGLALRVARKKTKPGLEGGGGRYTAPGQAAAPSTEPQSASRLEPTPSCG
jgi:hypothetical protein